MRNQITPKAPYNPHICDICGNVDSTTDFRINPYAHELYDEINEQLICNQCYKNLQDDI